MRVNVFPILALLALLAAVVVAVSYPLYGTILGLILTGAAITFAILSLKE